MKARHIITVITIIKLFSVTAATAQHTGNLLKITPVDSYNLAITTNKTTSLIFPFAIKSVDRGSQDILARQVEGVENILQVKAGKENFSETNLTVITADGNLYSFVVTYNSRPSSLILEFKKDTMLTTRSVKTKPPASFNEAGSSDADIAMTANTIRRNTNRTVWGVRNRAYKVMLRLNSIYIKNDVMYCQVACRNRSNINYYVDMLRFFIRDRKRSKRTAAQEVELKPVYVAGNTACIKAQSKESIVFALPKFTIPDAKYLAIEIREKNGGRHLLIKVSNRQIINAHVIRSA